MLQGIETVGDLNDKITRSDVNELVLVQEALQEEKIAADCGTGQSTFGCSICTDRGAVFLQ